MVKPVEEVRTMKCCRCGKSRTKDNYASIRRCLICDKDVCFDCAEPIDGLSGNLRNPGFNSDYPDYVCKICWEKGRPFREEIEDMRDGLYTVEEGLIDIWKCKVKNFNTVQCPSCSRRFQCLTT